MKRLALVLAVVFLASALLFGCKGKKEDEGGAKTGKTTTGTTKK